MTVSSESFSRVYVPQVKAHIFLCRSVIPKNVWVGVGGPATIRSWDDCERTPGEVTWCMNVWHPTELIEVCMNRTWSSSSPLAAKLNLSGYLEYLEISPSCKKNRMFAGE